LRIEGPCCIFDGPFCCGDSQFKVLTLDGASEVGRVTKKYAGFARELGSTADNFGIECELDWLVKNCDKFDLSYFSCILKFR